jgi:hypothetical protein
MATKSVGVRKRQGVGLEMKTFKGKGQNYLVFRTPKGAYHVFLEVEAKQAARDCGASKEKNTVQMWKDLWERP